MVNVGGSVTPFSYGSGGSGSRSTTSRTILRRLAMVCQLAGLYRPLQRLEAGLDHRRFLAPPAWPGAHILEAAAGIQHQTRVVRAQHSLLHRRRQPGDRPPRRPARRTSAAWRPRVGMACRISASSHDQIGRRPSHGRRARRRTPSRGRSTEMLSARVCARTGWISSRAARRRWPPPPSLPPARRTSAACVRSSPARADP